MKRFVQITALVLACLAIMVPQGVSAAGSEGIGGYAYGQANFYFSARNITDPSIAGAEVAFTMSTGASGLFLGIHDCRRNGGPMYPQARGGTRPVGYSSVPRTFCLFTFNNYTAGNFDGTLAWN